MKPRATPTRKAIVRLGLCAAAVAAAALMAAPAGGRDDEIRRVVVIHLDTTRTDDVGCYGGIPRTPNIDGVAAMGMRYLNSIAPTPMTSPSIASFMTGRLANRHGVYAVGGRLVGSLTTLTEILHDHGFVTGGFTSNVAVGQLRGVGGRRGDGRSLGFDQGFDVFKAIYELPETPEGVEPNAVPAPHCVPLVDAAIDFVREHAEDRLFLWMLHLDPHAPYSPPPPYDTMYEHDPRLVGSSVRLNAAQIHHQAYVSDRLDSHEYVARHMGEVSHVDQHLGRLLATLNGLPGRSLIVITADHGESLGDVGEWFTHGTNIRHPCVNVPLIVSCPGVVPIGVSETLVANIDLAPTILEMLGIGAEPLVANGLSMVPTFSHADPWPDRAIPIQVYDGGRWRGVRGSRFCLQSQLYANEGRRARAMLYDLRSDPREQTDVSGRYPEVLGGLLELEDAWFGQERFLVQDLSDDPEMIRRLKSLGYLR